MENIVEKLGFFDFLNLIITGLFTIIGTFAIAYQYKVDITIQILNYLMSKKQINLLFFTLCLFFILSIAYIVGMVCQELYKLVDENILKSFDRLIRDVFENNGFIKNSQKKQRYIDIKQEILKLNNGSQDNNCLDNNQYFFNYCEYQLQIRGLNAKTEKLRDIEGMAEAFCTSNILLSLLLVYCSKCKRITYKLPLFYFRGELIVLILFAIIFCFYRKRALKNRIRMTFALYEAIYDYERKDKNYQENKIELYLKNLRES